MEVRLVMFKANGQRRDFPVGGRGGTIGRGGECTLQIPLAVVSRRHCQISIDGDAVKVRDLGSSNGTFVNDKRVQEAPLAAGDRLVIGPVIFTVMLNGVPAEIKPIRTVIAQGTVEPVSDAKEGTGTAEADLLSGDSSAGDSTGGSSLTGDDSFSALPSLSDLDEK